MAPWRNIVFVTTNKDNSKVANNVQKLKKKLRRKKFFNLLKKQFLIFKCLQKFLNNLIDDYFSQLLFLETYKDK